MATRYGILELESAESTQTKPRALGPRESNPGDCRNQPEGRGRLGRIWVEPDRALFSSFAFIPTWPAPAWSRIPLVAGLAVREAIDERCGITVGLRWPNDLVVEEGKIGASAESGDGLVVVGCGIDIVWDDPMIGAAALFVESNAIQDRDLAVASVDR